MTIQEIAEKAWNAIKHPADPPFALCDRTHREKLIYQADSVKTSGVCADQFDRAVWDLLNPAEIEPEEKGSANKKKSK